MTYPAEWKREITEVNAEVNKLPYVADAEKYELEDFWADITEAGSGDCDDYAIAKLRRLVKLGWPIEALHLACCYVETGEYHAVLVVEAPRARQAFMLDNRQEEPVPLESLELIGYVPERIQQVGGQPGWVQWLPSEPSTLGGRQP